MGILAMFRGVIVPMTLPSSVLSVLLICVIGKTLYNIYLHPLAKIPGPFWWRASRLRFVYSLVSGNLLIDVKKLHEQYGEVVRTAPDEVSFAREDAWSDIFMNRPGHKPFLKDPVLFQSPPGQPPNLVTTLNVHDSYRMRQVFQPAFTERALSKQEATIQFYATLLTNRLKEIVNSPQNVNQGAVVNVVDWINWFAFDVIADLSFGESFGCLQDTKSHPWVGLVFATLKLMVVQMATRYFRGLETCLTQLVPTSMLKKAEDHYKFTLEKTHRRINLATQRDDFMTPVLENNDNFEIMSLPEVESTMPLLLLAGSETTATTLCGILSHLVQSSLELQKLEREIRGAFKQEEDISLRALQDLPFLNAVIHEGLRLCNPVAGGIWRIAPEGGDTVSGYFLPGGTHVTVNSAAISGSEGNFHRAKEFLPDRYLPSALRPAEFKNDRRDALKFFGLGGRNCLGRYIAMAEMRLVLALTIWNLDISMAPGKQTDWTKLKTYMAIEKKCIEIKIKARTKT